MKVGNGRFKMKNWKWMLILHFTFSISNFTFAATTATREMVTNFAARVSQAATNYTDAATNQLAQAIAPKADAVKTVSVNTGGASTNLVVRPVYATVNLVIRECETANGQKQYRLIRKED